MTSSVRTHRLFAASLAAVLAGGGLAAITVPAVAETGAVSYTCSVAGTDYQWSVNTDTDAPAKMFVGEEVKLVIDSDVVLPAEMAKWAYDTLEARSIEGTIDAQHTLAGAPITVTQSVPTTSLGDQSTTATTVPFTATATALPVKPSAVGDLVFEAGNLTAKLTATKADGTTQVLDVTCARPNGKAPVIDTVAVATRSTTALTLDRASVGFGAPVTATAKVTTTGGTAVGDVTFVVDGVSSTVPVRSGAASLTIDAAAVGDHSITASFVPKDATRYEGSSAAPVTFKVSRASSSTRVAITGKRVGQRTGAGVKVVGINGTQGTGKVRLVLRKVGNRGFLKAKTGSLTKGARTFNLGRLGKGRFKVVVTYAGDANHLTSKTVKRFRVRR